MHAQPGISDLRRIGVSELGLTADDLALLRLISEQKAIPLDQIARFQAVDPAVARQWTARLERVRCLQLERLLVDEEPWVWLTRRGARLANTGCSAPRRPPAITRLRHLRAVNDVRLHLRERFPRADWISQNQLRRGPGHLRESPNGVLTIDGRSSAVHVALSYMQRTRPLSAVADSSSRYDQVLYFCGPRTLGLLRSIEEEGDWPKLVVHDLPSSPAAPNRCPLHFIPSRAPTAQEQEALRLLAVQGAVPTDQFERFQSHRGQPSEDLLDGLVDAGFAIVDRPIVGEPEWIWLSERGVRASGTKLPLLRPRAGGLGKIRALNEARILIEESFPTATWIGRRQLLRERGNYARVPAGVVELEGMCHSVDVKLNRHNKEHWVSLIEERSERFDAVLILCSDPKTREFMEALQNARCWDKVLVRNLPGGAPAA